MKQMMFVCAALLLRPQAAGAQNAARDRDAAVAYLEKTKQEFLASIDGVSEAQWKFKAGPDRWSIAEVAEHIALSEPMILQIISEKVMKAPKATAPSQVTDEKVIALVTNRSQKAQAPEVLRPTNKWPTRDALTRDFLEARQKTIDFVKSTPDLRAHLGPHPAFKEIDGHQWVLFLAGHSSRHTDQIKEVKTSAAYPK